MRSGDQHNGRQITQVPTSGRFTVKERGGGEQNQHGRRSGADPYRLMKWRWWRGAGPSVRCRYGAPTFSTEQHGAAVQSTSTTSSTAAAAGGA